MDRPDAPNAPLDGEAAEPDASEQATEVRELVVSAALHGERVDKVLVTLAPEFSRTWLQRLIDEGHVSLDGVRVAAASRRVRGAQKLVVALVPTQESLAFKPQAMVLDVLFEDAHLLILNKPAGLVVHPAAGNWSGTLLNGLLAHHSQAAKLPRAGIVHRLDKDTSGVMMVGKSLQAVTALSRAIAAREVNRQYLALAHGEVLALEQSVHEPIGRDPYVRIRMAAVPGGKSARTDVRRLAAGDGYSAVLCKLHTGRTHQIRVHMAGLGHPLVADGVYGGKPALGMQRQALHAARLALLHPVDAKPMQLDAPMPEDFAVAWRTVATAPAVVDWY